MTDHNDQHVTVRPVKKSSFPWWAIVLLVVFVLLCAGTTYVGQRVLRWRDYSLSLAEVMRGDPTNTPRPRATSTPRESNTANNRVAAADAVEASPTPARVADGGAPEPTQTARVVIVTATFTPESPKNDPTPMPKTPTPALQGNQEQKTFAAGGGGSVPDSGLPSFQSRRVSHSHNDSYAPEQGRVRPGYGTSKIEIMTVVGYELLFQTYEGEVILGGGCQQAIMGPDTNAWNAGGTDWNYTGWYWDEFQTEPLNEMAVLSWELAQQQIDWEDCPSRSPEERLAHVWVIEQDRDHLVNGNVRYVYITPWHEWRRASGVDNTIMFMPGDRVYGWSIGLGSAYTGTPGQDGQDNLCLGGECYLPSAPTIGWCGGCIVNSTWPGEIPNNATPISQDRINEVMATLPPEG